MNIVPLHEKYASSGWLANFSLSDECKEKLAQLVPLEALNGIEKACQGFLSQYGLEIKKTKQGEVNKKIHKIHHICVAMALGRNDDTDIETLRQYVKDKAVIETLENCVIDNWPGHFPGEKRDFPELQKYASFWIGATIKYAKSKAGSPGLNRKAVRRFSVILYSVCKSAGKTPTIINTSSGHRGLLHQILSILAPELGFTFYDMSGTFEGVLRDIREQQSN